MAGPPKGNRFPRALRVVLRRDFERIRAQGVPRRDRLLTVRICPNGLPHPRLGLAVGRHVGNAVVRNRVKRWVRESFRTHRDRFRAGYDFLVSGTPRAADAGLGAIAESLLSLARRVPPPPSDPSRAPPAPGGAP